MVNVASSMQNNSPERTTDATLRLPVDIEHGGIRAVGCVSLLVAVVAYYFILEGIIWTAPVLSVLVAMVASSLTSYGLERYLKGRWTSGRELLVSDEQITLKRKGEVERAVDPTQHVNVLAWHFEVKRTARVKKGWLVVGLGLQQEDDLVPVYTFMSPDDFKAFEMAGHFTQLEKKDKKKNKDSSVSSMRRAGEQRRLFEAETDRSHFGAELQQAAFVQFVERLQADFPAWMPTH